MKQKLKLNKEKVSKLTDLQSSSIKGGKELAVSTRHNFTCGLCTGGDGTIDSWNTCAKSVCFACS
ncbi:MULTISPECIES: class I lanthipeptide [Chryseobacterium]|uniref:class I lanthipeptide n=1 Tax=Chryseobacterium TaxID=59732 RepID=UPI001E5E87E2|nr:class I lanthipeptide [Chryseobacterium gleum]MCD9616617.1 class I lanthipeptide [Chryseobacterium gleum]